MTLLKKYKIYIFTLLIAIFLVTLAGAYCYIESRHIVKHYTITSDGIIAIAAEHFKKDSLEWDFEYPLDEEYVEELAHVYLFSNKGFQIKRLNLISPNGVLIFSNDPKNIGKNFYENRLELLDKENTHLFISDQKKGLAFHRLSDKLRIDTFSPITVNKELQGYVQIEYHTTPREAFYIFYDQILIPIMIGLLLFLFVFLNLYIKRHILVEKETENSNQMLLQLFENASDGIVILNKDKKVEMMNSSMKKMIGYNPKEETYPISCEHILHCHNADGRLCGIDCPVKRETKSNLIDFELVNREKKRLHVSASRSLLKNEITGDSFDIMLIRNESVRKSHELQLQTLEEFEKLMNSQLDLNNISNFIVNKIKKIANCDDVCIFNGKSYETSTIINNKNMPNTKIPFHEDIVALSYSTRKIQKINEQNIQEYKKILHLYGAKTLVSIPLIVNDQIIGVLLLVYRKSTEFDSQQENLLRKFATDIAALLKVYLLMLDTNNRKELNEKLYKIEMKLQSSTDEKDLPVDILEEIQDVTGIDFIVYRSTNPDPQGMSGIGSIIATKNYKESGDIINNTVKWGRTIYIEDFNVKKNLPIEFNDFTLVSNENLVSIYSIPVIYNNQVLGGILFGHRSKLILTEEKSDLLRSIVTMLAIHLENKNLQRQMENEATILERQRISREIHDGLAQNIGFINIQLNRLKKLINKNELIKAVQEIDVVKEAVEESYIELRETIDQLRDIKSYNQSIEEWIRENALDFQRTHGIQVEIETLSDEKILLNENQKVQLTRVVQEIFNNIRKHAKAKNVKIILNKNESGINLIIKDDGIGFDMQVNHKRKFGGNGLYILKERIQSIHGEILIESTIENGTKIEVQIPEAI